ncbi:hypothetical protein ACHQM5_017274 [Ranunculus cassubicifolius]
MESKSYMSLFVILIGFVLSTQAYDFTVGGKDGWVLNPSESYSQWSGRNRFITNDVLDFKYNQATDSVLVVSKQDFDTCNTSNPISKLEGGSSSFRVDTPGPFYFITGNQSNCQAGQKLALVVISPRTEIPSASPTNPLGLPPPSSSPMLSPPSPPTMAPVSSPPSPSLPSSPTSGPGMAPGMSPGMAPSGSPNGISSPPAGSPMSGPSSSPGPGGADAAPGQAPSSSPVSTSLSGFAFACSLFISMTLVIFSA